MLFGYMRVSTVDKNLDRQEQLLKDAGCERIFFEKVTGTKLQRPELNRTLEFLREGDTVIITDLTRLSRSTKDLIEIVELSVKAVANLHSLKEAWLDTTTTHGKLMFTIFAGLEQFERDISERTRKGLVVAASQGRIAGRPQTRSVSQGMTLHRRLKARKRAIMFDNDQMENI